MRSTNKQKMNKKMRNCKEESEAKGNEGFTLNLTVRGSPAHIYAQPPKGPKEDKPCLFPNNLKKKMKGLDISLAVDKIILLAERLELADRGKAEIEPISLSPEAFKMKEEVIKTDGNQLSVLPNGVVLEGRSVLPVAFPSERETHSTLCSPNFPIDLSSLDESDESGNECELSQCQGESRRSETNGSRDSRASQIRFVEEFNRDRASFEESCKRSPSNARLNDDSFVRKTEVADDRMKPGGDLVCLYVNAVNDHNLTKYFRPCRTCNEAYCVCADVHAVSRMSPPGFPNASQFKDNKINSAYFRTRQKKTDCFGRMTKISKGVGTDVNITRFACSERECLTCRPSDRRRTDGADRACYVCRFPSHRSCPEPSDVFYETRFRTPENDRRSECTECAPDEFLRCCTLKLESSGPEICSCVESSRLLAYTSSLASAARSARNLARDLELILTTFESED